MTVLPSSGSIMSANSVHIARMNFIDASYERMFTRRDSGSGMQLYSFIDQLPKGAFHVSTSPFTIGRRSTVSPVSSCSAVTDTCIPSCSVSVTSSRSEQGYEWHVSTCARVASS